MSDHAEDAYCASEVAQAWIESNYEQEANLLDKLWKQKNERLIHVSGMEDSHIINTIRMLDRGGWHLKDEWISVFNKELQRRKNEKV